MIAINVSDYYTRKEYKMSFADIRMNADIFRDSNRDILTKSISVTLTSADATVVTSSTSGLLAGQSISGLGIATGATILSITNKTTFELSANATKTAQEMAVIELYSDAQLQDMKYDVAVGKLKSDLQNDLNIADDDLADVLETIATNYETVIKGALLYLQSMFFYFEILGNKEGKEYMRYKYYAGEYDRQRLLFRRFVIRQASYVSAASMTRG